MSHMKSLLWMTALCLALIGCPQTDDDSAGDDDVADDDESSTPPEIFNLDVFIEIPEGEMHEMVNFTFQFTDVEGDIQGGEIWLWVDGSFAGIGALDDEEDATEGALLLYGNIGGDTGFQYEETYLFGVQLMDADENESNLLEQEFTIPAE